MFAIRKILCPVDFSEFSRHAIDHAVAIARWFDGSVTAVHVVPAAAALVPEGDAGLSPPFILTHEDVREFEKALTAFVRTSAEPARVHASVQIGNVSAEIVRLMQEQGSDLLVLGTHGRSGFDRLLLGSTTEKLLRRARCPVLIVPRRAPETLPPGLFSRILCAVDFSPASLKALALADRLAAAADAALLLVHVLQPRTILDAMSGHVPHEDDDAREAVRQRLLQLVADEARSGRFASAIVTSGHPDREIVREASRCGCDLIVIGAHGGRSALGAFGSTTSHVVRQAECPVLTLGP